MREIARLARRKLIAGCLCLSLLIVARRRRRSVGLLRLNLRLLVLRQTTFLILLPAATGTGAVSSHRRIAAHTDHSKQFLDPTASIRTPESSKQISHRLLTQKPIRLSLIFSYSIVAGNRNNHPYSYKLSKRQPEPTAAFDRPHSRYTIPSEETERNLQRYDMSGGGFQSRGRSSLIRLWGWLHTRLSTSFR